MQKKITVKTFHLYLSCTATFLLAYAISYHATNLSGIILIISGIIHYFIISIIGGKSYLKIKAIFSGVWMFTIGLSLIRIMEYQVIWESRTWLLLYLSQILLYMGVDLSYIWYRKYNQSLQNKISNLFSINTGKHYARISFFALSAVSLVGILSFLITFWIKGFLPIFETQDNQLAPILFYTRFLVFFVASTSSSSFAYILIKKYQLPLICKILLSFYIIVLVFLIPMLMVHRGIFLSAAIFLTAGIYLSSTKKLYVLVLSLVLILGIYQMGSVLRGYSENQLQEIFPSDKKYEIPGYLKFLYTYFTVSHDNFNSLVVNKNHNTNGILQVIPFNVVLRSKTLRQKIDNETMYLESFHVLPQFNTYNFVAYFYSDFGILGITIFMIFWGFIFGLFEQLAHSYPNGFTISTYAVCLIAVFFSYFSPWMSNFTIWLYWGTILLIFLLIEFLLKNQERSLLDKTE